MKDRFAKLPLAPIVLLVLGCCPARAQATADAQKPVGDCDEYLSSTKVCRVRIDMKSVRGPVTPQYKVAAPVHSDVTVNSGAEVTTVLRRASPFLTCSIAGTPSAPARDLSASIGSALTMLGGLVIAAEPVPSGGEAKMEVELTARPKTLPEIDEERRQLVNLESDAANNLTKLYRQLREALETNWRYSFAPDKDPDDKGLTAKERDQAEEKLAQEAEKEASEAVDRLAAEFQKFLAAPVPDLAEIQALSKQMQDDFGKFYTGNAPDRRPANTGTVGAGVGTAAAYAELLQTSASDFKKKVKQYADYVASLRKVIPGTPNPLTTISLKMDPYRQKTVTETITCKDAVSGTQPFASIIYTAFFENTPIFDISTGAIMSLLPGRQVGTVSGPLAGGTPAAATSVPTSGPCGAFNPSETCLGITSATRVQFMPAIIFELHPVQGKCFWAKNGAQRHPLGYVCSLGLAGGLSVNPNNGTASAEFFEGFSVGISRVAFLFGIHNGRYQTFADGYYAGEAVPGGTTARTSRIWTNHFAIGITYRIVQR
jgi:hypothetical protein